MEQERIKNYFIYQMNTSFALQKDKNKLMMEIEQYEMNYQDALSFPFLNYGIEIEFKKATIEVLNRKLKLMQHTNALYYETHWLGKEEDQYSKTDEYGNTVGGEIVSPICESTRETWQELWKVCRLIEEHGGYVDEDCSVHIHVDFSIFDLDKKKWHKLLCLWAIYEEVLLQFAAGEFQQIRPGYLDYAYPIREAVQESIMNGNPIWEHGWLDEKKENAVNLRYLKQYLNDGNPELYTVEFRIGNGTLNPVIIQNLIRCYYGLLKAVKEDNPILDDYLKKYEGILYGVSELEYQESDFDMACELVDIIFDNNTDKFCFLKQYTGGMVKDSKENKKYQKTL